MKLPDSTLPWPVPMAVVVLVAESESCRLKAYKCPAGVWTIGWGETDGVNPGDTCTQEQADQWLCEGLTDRTAAVRKMCTEWPNDNQLGAMVSLSYNIGLRDDKRKAGLYYSSVRRAHNAADAAGAARAFGLINKARVNGVLTVLPGLVTRRAREAALYLTPEPGEPHMPLPQAVAAESSLAASPIAQVGGGTVATGSVLGLASLGDQVGPITTMVDTAKHWAEQLGLQPLMLLAGALVVGGAVVVYQRVKQRSGGWA